MTDEDEMTDEDPCAICYEDPCVCDDDDEDWCVMCGDERPCECDAQLNDLIDGAEETE